MTETTTKTRDELLAEALRQTGQIIELLGGSAPAAPAAEPAQPVAGSATAPAALADAPAPTDPGGEPLTRKQIERMKPDEINARWGEIQEFLARGGR